jgi:uncharacterized repeat protein (TIGR04076 family)
MSVSDQTWQFMQQHLGYSDEEMKLFRENPRNEEVLAKAPEMMTKTIVCEVVESHGCASGHRKGDKIYFDGAGNLLSKMNPKRVCLFALANIVPGVFAAGELMYAGVDPNQMRFKRASCFDVGVRCGGWGQIVLELRVEDRPK